MKERIFGTITMVQGGEMPGFGFVAISSMKTQDGVSLPMLSETDLTARFGLDLNNLGKGGLYVPAENLADGMRLEKGLSLSFLIGGNPGRPEAVHIQTWDGAFSSRTPERHISSLSAMVDARPVPADQPDWRPGRSEYGINHRAPIKVMPGTVDMIDPPHDVVEDDTQGYLTEREQMLADEPLWLSIVKLPWELILMIGRGFARLGAWIFGGGRKRHS